jgi:5-methylcytosine-specific restriction endonuclease McrA
MSNDLFLCSKCQSLKPLLDFYPNVQAKVAAGYKHHCRACRQAWQAANTKISTETRRRYDQTYSDRHREAIRLKDRIGGRKRRVANPEKARLQGRIKWYIRKARHQGALVNDLSPAQIEELIAAKHSRCDYCGQICEPVTIDHITPLVKQGNNTLWNVTIACISCNSRKLVGPPPVPVQPLLLTLASPRQMKKSA